MAALRAPGGRMQGAEAQAMSVHIVEPTQRSRRPPAAATRRAHGSCGRSLRCSSSTMRTDFSFGIRDLCRFRANIFTQKSAVGAVFRAIPFEIKSFEALGLPPVVEKLCERPRGLVLVTGPTGSGKSTTLAAMIDKINRERHE